MANILKLRINFNQVILFLFSLICLIITRQVPFSAIASLANIAIILLFIFYFLGEGEKSDKKGKYFLFYLIWIGGLIAYSMILQNDITLILRFSLIIILLLLAYNIVLPISCLDILLFFLVCQAIFLMGMEVYLLQSTLNETRFIRSFYSLKEWGDIYSFSGNYFFIQVKGNALLPFGFMLTFIPLLENKKRKWFYRILLLGGIVCCGNFAYYISLFVFILGIYIRRNNSKVQNYIFKLFLLLATLVCLSPFILNYVTEVLDRKNDVSLGTRSDQFYVLMNDLQDNIFTIFLGKGLGNVLTIATSFRDYTNNIYFELQSVYFLNQLGIFNFLLFILLNLYLSYKFICNKFLLFIYACYLIYAVTNPYFLDTNQIVVIIVLTSINKYINENRLCSSFI